MSAMVMWDGIFEVLYEHNDNVESLPDLHGDSTAKSYFFNIHHTNPTQSQQINQLWSKPNT